MGERGKALFPRAAGRATGGLDTRCVIIARKGDRILLVRPRRHPVYGSALALGRRLTSPRILGIATFNPGRHVHAQKIRETDELDPEVQAWLG